MIPVNFAVIEKCSMPIFAVITGNGGAIKADLSLELKPGTGKVYSLVESLVGTSTQNTEKVQLKFPKTTSRMLTNTIISSILIQMHQLLRADQQALQWAC